LTKVPLLAIVHKALRTALLNELEIILFGTFSTKIGNLYIGIPSEYLVNQTIEQVCGLKGSHLNEGESSQHNGSDAEAQAHAQKIGKQLFVHLLCLAFHVKNQMNKQVTCTAVKYFIEENIIKNFGHLYASWSELHKGQITMSQMDMIKFNQIYLKSQIMKGQAEKEPTIDYNLIVDKMIEMFQGNTRMHPLDSPIRTPPDTPEVSRPILPPPVPAMTQQSSIISYQPAMIPMIPYMEKRQASSSSSGGSGAPRGLYSKNAVIMSTISNPPLISEYSQEGIQGLPMLPDLQLKMSGTSHQSTTSHLRLC
jgi:hypothetical protein